MLAFILNEWREEKNQQKHAARILERLIIEIKENYLQLKEGHQILITIQSRFKGFEDRLDGSEAL